jgi:hypothetical protein
MNKLIVLLLSISSIVFSEELPIYNYDQANRLDSIEFSDGSKVEYAYEGSEEEPNRVKTYDSAGQPIQEIKKSKNERTEARGMLDFFNLSISPADRGKVGKGEVSNQIRVTYVNGVLNEAAHVDYAAKVISEAFGGVNVHYVHNNTSGLFTDIIETLDVKFGFFSDSAEALVDLWRELIAEMGGVEGGGRIYHMAHSGGSMHTKAAAEMMSPEELAMIEVVTYGAPFMVENPNFISVTNYVSKRDGVGLMGAALNPSAATIVGELEEGPPFLDHIFTDGTYLGLLYLNGARFADQYGRIE